MTLSNDGRCMAENKYLEEEISAVLAESREARNHLRKLGRVMKTVAAHRLKELIHIQALEKLATWRRTHGFDQIANGDNQWASRPLPPTPEHFTASLWSDLNKLKDAISLSGNDGSSQRAKSFIKEIEQGTVSFTDEEFARIKRFVERRGRDAAHVTVASIDTALPRSPRSRSSEISSDLCVSLERDKEGRMDPERDQLQSPSVCRGFETAGQQCHPNWETGRTTTAGCLPAGVGSNLGGNTLSLAEITTPRAASNTIFLQANRKPKTNEENKQFDPGGKGEETPPWKAAVLVVFSFSGGNAGPGCRYLRFVLLSVLACLLDVYCSYQVIIFSAS